MDELDEVVRKEAEDRERAERQASIEAAAKYADKRRGATEHDVMQAIQQNVEEAEGRTPSPQGAPPPTAEEAAAAREAHAAGRTISRPPPADIRPKGSVAAQDRARGAA